MKEFEPVLNEKALQGIEINVNQEQKKEFKLIANQRKRLGLTLWEYNEETFSLGKAVFKKQDVSITSLNVSSLKVNHRVEVSSGCYYFQALNRKSAKAYLEKKGKVVK